MKFTIDVAIEVKSILKHSSSFISLHRE